MCRTLIPFVARALSNQCVRYQRLPIKEDFIDWVINDTDEFTVALDHTSDGSMILLASRGDQKEAVAARLANIAAELCRDYDVHTLYWNGSEHPIDARDFLFADATETHHAQGTRSVRPRRVRSGVRATQRPPAFNLFDVDPAPVESPVQGVVRAQLTSVSSNDESMLEMQDRVAKTVPLRLSAWALSISTAIIAAPLAIPLVAHNLMRGEDVRSGAMAFGVAGLFAVMAQTGMAPELASLL